MVTLNRGIAASAWLVVYLLAMTGIPALAQEPDTSNENLTFNWLEYEDARQQSRLTGKPLLLYFTKPRCSDCRRLERETFAHKDIRPYVRKYFVATHLNAQDFPALMRKYEIETLPATWFIDPSGRGLTSIRGFRTPDRLLPVLQYIATGAYETITWQEWQEGKRPVVSTDEPDTTERPAEDRQQP